MQGGTDCQAENVHRLQSKAQRAKIFIHRDSFAKQLVIQPGGVAGLVDHHVQFAQEMLMKCSCHKSFLLIGLGRLSDNGIPAFDIQQNL